MGPRELVENALLRGQPQFQTIPDHIRPAVERHCVHLIELASNLHAAGKSCEAIHILVENLLKSYSFDLIAALELQS